jgi:hypothetical protein
VKRSVSHCTGCGWAPGSVWTSAEGLASTGIRSPDHPVRCESLRRLRYLGPSLHRGGRKTFKRDTRYDVETKPYVLAHATSFLVEGRARYIVGKPAVLPTLTWVGKPAVLPTLTWVGTFLPQWILSCGQRGVPLICYALLPLDHFDLYFRRSSSPRISERTVTHVLQSKKRKKALCGDDVLPSLRLSVT